MFKGLIVAALFFLAGAGSFVAQAWRISKKVGCDMTQLFTEPSYFKAAILHYPWSDKGTALGMLWGGLGLALVSGLIGLLIFKRLKSAASA